MAIQGNNVKEYDSLSYSARNVVVGRLHIDRRLINLGKALMNRLRKLGTGGRAMRLIDAEELMMRLRCNVLIDVTPELEDEVTRQPTAFDKEKVIKEIRNVPHGYYNVDTENEIIGIVEKGGMD